MRRRAQALLLTPAPSPLWRQGAGMGIDRFEAELLINGACFRAGVVTVNGRTLRLVRGNE
ncbi:MAG: hypothetical protein U1A27_08290 [Phycisphaerae bacterium]